MSLNRHRSTSIPAPNPHPPSRLRGFRRALCIIVLALALYGLLSSPRPLLLAFAEPIRAEA